MGEETGAHAGTTLEGIVQGCLDQFSDDEIELLAQVSAAADRPLNWNVLTVDAREPDRVPRQLSAGDRAAELGGRLVALTMPVQVPMNMSFLNFCGIWLIPGWSDVLSVPVPERIARLRDPETRLMHARAVAVARGRRVPSARRLRRLPPRRHLRAPRTPGSRVASCARSPRSGRSRTSARCSTS